MDLQGGPLNLVNPWSMPLLLQSTLNALGDMSTGRHERWVVLDACVVITLVPIGDTVSGLLTFERGFKIKSSSSKKAEHVFAGSVP